jgi:hypothetical protein
MPNLSKWFLAIPVLIIVLGFYILLSGEAVLGALNPREVRLANSQVAEGGRGNTQKDIAQNTVSIADLRSNRESAYPYFLLGTGLLVVLLILPKLGELSFSPTNGITIKVLNELKDAVEEAKITTQAVAFKTNQASMRSTPEAFTQSGPDLTSELKKLEENAVKLTAYSNLLEKLTQSKGKTK